MMKLQGHASASKLCHMYAFAMILVSEAVAGLENLKGTFGSD